MRGTKLGKMINVRPLTDALARRAAIELNEDPASMPYYIHALREWIKSQPHLRTPLSKFTKYYKICGNYYNDLLSIHFR